MKNTHFGQFLEEREYKVALGTKRERFHGIFVAPKH